MSKNIVLIQSHCNTKEKQDYLMMNINKLKEHNVDILLFSHIDLPESIINSVDYYVFDKSNPILYKERLHHYWWENKLLRLETTLPDYGWTVFNQIIKSYNLVSTSKYDYVFIFCYDVIIDDVVNDSLSNPKTSIFTHLKPDALDDKGNFSPVKFDTALVFSCFKHDEFRRIVNSFSKDEYIKRTDLIAEGYFEMKVKDNDLYYKNNLSVKDFFSEGDDIFNLTKDKEYDLFVDNLNLLKFRVINKKNKKIDIIINHEIISINSDYYVHNKEVDELKIFGCFIGGEYNNWLPHLNKIRINKMIVKA